jgi:hypothetical protein
MPRLQPLACLLLVLALPAPSSAQPLFKVTPNTIASAEGGSMKVLLIQAGDDHFSLRIPNGYGTQVSEESRSILFAAESGVSAITIHVTGNYPGALPKMEDLSATVAKKFPGASLVQSSRCVSDYGPGLCFDLIQPAQNNLTLRIRDAFISYPAGSFEFTFTCNGADYDKNRLSFVWLLNSFRSQPQPAKKEP